MPVPPALSIMQAKQVPAVGGDTLFANQYLAYDRLSATLKQLLGQMRAVHSDFRVAGPTAGLNALRTNKTNESSCWRPTSNSHPVIRTHPETGRKALYVNVAATLNFEDMTPHESAPWLDYLFELNHRPEFIYRQVWRENTIVIWDNRCLVHLAVNDCPQDHRLMHRLQIAGDAPR
jgi:taurine dioxygenase